MDSYFKGTVTATKFEGTATNATNVTTQINGINISNILEDDGITAKKATYAYSATDSSNVISRISGKDITAIFEENGVTVKEATYATNANYASSTKLNDSWRSDNAAAIKFDVDSLYLIKWYDTTFIMDTNVSGIKHSYVGFANPSPNVYKLNLYTMEL